MLKTLKNFNCRTDYALETFNSIRLNKLKSFFKNLPVDPYLKENYRFRRLSRFQVSDGSLIQLPHNYFFQSQKYNPLLGDVVREYAELERNLIATEEFQKIVSEFFEFCKYCSSHNEIAVHQIEITASLRQIGNPAPEGIHRDGVDMVGIFCVERDKIEGGVTDLYKDRDSNPVFSKILNPGELIIFDDRQFFHFTSPIKAIASEGGIRDVFVLTCPGLLPPDQ